ncbi:glycosyltransferase family 4 protein [Robertmurraya kyonggiensis]|uniref:Glycosyltransferase family 4 protein n=1 Tax=Robertmurraya kyonggiensis TaxID=1037680 RepID=A0A4V5P155_9BACI|nr:glycosyltransferase family 1 protein [Robertmurraya kyonggiensis]TKC16990.1 glycosyltransferase family 4 protein [Robertmurraya kyonggiensis]
MDLFKVNFIHNSLIATVNFSDLPKESKQKKKFVIDIRMWRHSGIGTYIKSTVLRVINAFPNVEFTLIIGIDFDEKELNWPNNVSFLLFSSSIYTIREQIEFIKKVNGRYDYFWSPHYNIPIFFMGKLFATVHDVFHLAIPQYNKGLKKIYARILFTVLRFRAKKIFTVSEFTKQELIKYIGVKPKKIIAISNGIEEEWFALPQSERVLEKPYVLYVGNVKPHKNLISLIQAFKLIKDEIKQDLVIVGKKEGFITGDKFIGKAAEELSDRIVFTGYVSDELLKRYYKHADVLVFPSIYEGFGLPPLEAMAVNCPTIVSNKASIPEVCEDASLYIDPHNPMDIAEKILLVLKNEEIKKDLIGRGKAHVKKFKWRNTSEQIIQEFKEVLK